MSWESFRQKLARRLSREEEEGLTLTLGFLGAALIVAAFGLLAREVLAVSGSGELDREVSRRVMGTPIPAGPATARAASFFGDWRFLAPATAATAAVLAVRGRRVSAILFVGAVLGGLGLEIVLKIAFHRPRPELPELIEPLTTFSFPSGHATMATVFFGGLAAVVFHVTRRPLARGLAVCLAALAIGAVALSRIYLGVHWLTDVSGGILVGLFWVVAAATATEVVVGRRSDRRGRTG